MDKPSNPDGLNALEALLAGARPTMPNIATTTDFQAVSVATLPGATPRAELPTVFGPDGQQHRLTSHCAECGNQFGVNHVARMMFPGDGLWRHTNCDDPKLENDIG